MKSHQYRKPHRYKRKKSILKNRFFWLGVLISIFITALFYFLFISNIFQIENIITTGEKKVSEDDLKSLIEKNLENKILLFKTKSIFSVNLNELRKDILSNFPKIAEVEIKRDFPNNLNVFIIERVGIAVWCQNEVCFLLDSEGIAFESLSEVEPHSGEIMIGNSVETGKIKLGEKVVIEDKSSFPPFAAARVIEKEYLSKILAIHSKLSDLKIPIKEFTIISNDKLEVSTNEGWQIYLDLRGDIEWQITKLRAVLEEKIPPERRKDLEYIELRFGNFAPFKYRAPQ